MKDVWTRNELKELLENMRNNFKADYKAFANSVDKTAQLIIKAKMVTIGQVMDMLDLTEEEQDNDG